MTCNYRNWLLWLVVSVTAIVVACDRNRTASNDQPSPSSPTSNNSPAIALPKIVALGDSLTAGYGLSPAESYPSLLQKRLDADGFKYEVVNAGVSGDTSAGGLRRIDWSLEGGEVRFLILELGANDFLRGQPVAETKKNLSEIISRAKRKDVTVLVAGMYTLTSSGQDYQRQIHEMYHSLARDHNVTLIPFFLEDVAGNASLNLEDGIHPNAEGTKIVAETVYKYLRPHLTGGDS